VSPLLPTLYPHSLVFLLLVLLQLQLQASVLAVSLGHALALLPMKLDPVGFSPHLSKLSAVFGANLMHARLLLQLLMAACLRWTGVLGLPVGMGLAAGGRAGGREPAERVRLMGYLPQQMQQQSAPCAARAAVHDLPAAAPPQLGALGHAELRLNSGHCPR
jgi:hypothetical protein